MFRELDRLIEKRQRNESLTTRVISFDEIDLWARTSADGWATEHEGLADFMFSFGRIGAQCKGAFPYLAELDGNPISTGSLFIYDDVCALAGASTIPAGRNQGAQTALLEDRLEFAAEKGCKLAIMGASPGSQSQKNAQKNGFKIAYTRTKWQLRV
jgi:GNAT superfamily N-acetyltransferase